MGGGGNRLLICSEFLGILQWISTTWGVYFGRLTRPRRHSQRCEAAVMPEEEKRRTSRDAVAQVTYDYGNGRPLSNDALLFGYGFVQADDPPPAVGSGRDRSRWRSLTLFVDQPPSSAITPTTFGLISITPTPTASVPTTASRNHIAIEPTNPCQDLTDMSKMQACRH